MAKRLQKPDLPALVPMEVHANRCSQYEAKYEAKTAYGEVENAVLVAQVGRHRAALGGVAWAS